MSLINWCNDNDGFAMVVLTAVYAITTIGMFRSSNKMLKISLQQKEQERFIAALPILRDIDEICKNIPDTADKCEVIKDKLLLLDGQISTIMGIEAYKKYIDFYNYVSILAKKEKISREDSLWFAAKLTKLKGCFHSSSVVQTETKQKKITFLQKVFKKQNILDVPILKQALLVSWGADTSYCGVEGTPASKGQCAVSAMIIQDYLKGDICKIKIGDESHYFNFIKGNIIDVTADQFPNKIDYKNYKIVSREEFKPETIKRYNVLKQRVNEFLKHMALMQGIE